MRLCFLPVEKRLNNRSWEKNLHLLLSAYPQIASRPKLVFVGDGPARVELEQTCLKEGYDATFMGHRVGTELAECFASADIFAFPSFTEVSRFSTSGTMLIIDVRSGSARSYGFWITSRWIRRGGYEGSRDERKDRIPTTSTNL